MMKEEHIELLLKSLDAELINSEQVELDLALAEDEDLRLYKEELLQMRNSLGELEYSFNEDFASQVDSKLFDDFEKTLYKIFRWITVPSAVAVCVLLVMNYMSAGTLSLDSLLGVDSVSDEIITFNIYGH